MEDIEFVKPEKQIVSVRLDRKDIKNLKKIAHEKGLGHSTLARILIKEKLNQSQKMTFRNRLYGYRNKREYKDKVYRHQTPGLLKETGGDKLGLATIMVPRRNLKQVTDFLDKSKATYRTREVWVYR